MDNRIVLIHLGIGSGGFNSYGRGMEGSWINHGLAAIGAYLIKRDYKYDYLDLRRYPHWRAFFRSIEEIQPAMVGISATTIDYDAAVKTARGIRRVSPRTKIILGGIHGSVCSEICLKEDSFDHIVAGEGEAVFAELIEGQHKERVVRGIPIQDLDQLPFIDRGIFGKEERSLYPKLLPEPFTTFIASRGCPYHCTFCQPAERILFGIKVRSRSPRNLIEELLKCMSEYGIKSYLIHDDCLLWDIEWIEGYIQLLEEKGIGLPFAIQSRADLVCNHSDAIRSLARAGLRMILIGFESGSQRILDLIQKGTTVEQNLKAAQICRDQGIALWANYMFGIPGEEKVDVARTVEMVREIKPEVYSPAFFTPYPGSSLGDDCRRHRLSLIKDMKGFKRNPHGAKIKGIDYRYLRKAVRQSKGENRLEAFLNEVRWGIDCLKRV